MRNSTKKQIFVYVDYTTENTPRPFYVGKGDQRRLKNFTRNKRHASIAAAHGINRKIVFGPTTQDQALTEERRLVTELKTFHYGGEGHWGANFTRGGDTDRTGAHCSDEHKRHLSEHHRSTGYKGGMEGKHHSEETKMKIRVSNKGLKRSNETRERCSEAQRRRAQREKEQGVNRSRKLSPETIAKIKVARARQIIPKKSEETRRKMSIAQRKRFEKERQARGSNDV